MSKSTASKAAASPTNGLTLGDLATRFGCDLVGDPDVIVAQVATLAQAGPGDLAFLANTKYRRYLSTTMASAVVLTDAVAGDCPTNAIIATDPYVVYAHIAQILHPPQRPASGRHAAAYCDTSAVIANSASIAPGAVIEAGVRVGERVRIGPNCVVGANSVIGDDSTLVANVTICHGVKMGVRVTVHPGVVIGSDGFGFARDESGWVKVPQIGTVIIGDDVDIGAGTTIDRGAMDDTVIEHGVKLDNQIQVAHNVRIGEHTVVAACTGISGSTSIGKRCLIAGAVGFVGHLDITDDVTITGQTMVNRSISEPGVYSSALPMDDAVRWRKNSARFRRLDDLARTVKRLAKLIDKDR